MAKNYVKGIFLTVFLKKKKRTHKRHLFLNQTYLHEIISDETAYGFLHIFPDRILNCHTFLVTSHARTKI